MSADQKTSAPTHNTDDLVAVARVVRVRGLRGEVVADLLTDFPDRFDGLERIIAVTPDGSRKTLQLEEHWLQARQVVFKFAGIENIEGARELIGYELTVPETERVELLDDEYYDWELTGCRVETIAGVEIGVVRSVMHTGSTDLLVVDNLDGKRDHLIPLADEICVEIDKGTKLIRIDAPEGLLDF